MKGFDDKSMDINNEKEYGTGEQERHIMSTMFSNLFPSLNVNGIKPSNTKRMVLVHFNGAKDIVEIRHYYIKQNLTDMNNKLKKMINNKKVPNLSDIKDISQYFNDDAAYVSESDIDHLPNSKMNIEEYDVNGKASKKKINIRLFEIGPRLTLKLVKIEESFLTGSIFYHRYNRLSHKEKKQQKSLIENKLKIKEDRKKIQEENVLRKQERMKEIENLLTTNDHIYDDIDIDPEMLGKRTDDMNNDEEDGEENVIEEDNDEDDNDEDIDVEEDDVSYNDEDIDRMQTDFV